MTFIDACLRGEADLADIDDYVEQWHTTETGLSIEAHLGLTAEEYGLWVERPEVLPYILFSRRHEIPMRKALSLNEGCGLAARGVSDSERQALIAWLKKTGRIA